MIVSGCNHFWGVGVKFKLVKWGFSKIWWKKFGIWDLPHLGNCKTKGWGMKKLEMFKTEDGELFEHEYDAYVHETVMAGKRFENLIAAKSCEINDKFEQSTLSIAEFAVENREAFESLFSVLDSLKKNNTIKRDPRSEGIESSKIYMEDFLLGKKR